MRAKIDTDQRLVATSRKLVARFEKKIQATLARVWGEDASVAGEPSAALIPEQPEPRAHLRPTGTE